MGHGRNRVGGNLDLVTLGWGRVTASLPMGGYVLPGVCLIVTIS